MTGRIHSIETFGTLDGPGVRFVVFFQGCPLRCSYCHNPDTWNPAGGLVMESAALVKQALRCRTYYEKGGGVTLSGGEPLLQADFAAELLQLFRKEGFHTALDTSGCLFNDDVCRALSQVSLVLLDIKHVEEDAHRALTGVGMDGARDFLAYVRKQHIPYWVRSVIVPGLNDTCAYARALADHIRHGNHPPERIELARFHRMAMEKWRSMGRVCPLEDTPEADVERIREMETVLRDAGLPVVAQSI